MDSDRFSGRRSALLGLFVAVIAFIGLNEFVSETAMFAGRVVLVIQDDYTSQSWTEKTYVADTVGWYVVEGIMFFSAALAAYVGSWVSPYRSKLYALVALVLALGLTLFLQLPHLSAWVVWFVWFLATPLGALVGICLQWLSSRSKS